MQDTATLKQKYGFEERSIAGKFRILFGVLTAITMLIVACAFGGYWYSSSSQAQFRDTAQISLLAAKARSEVGDARVHAQAFLQKGSAGELDQARQSLRDASEALGSTHDLLAKRANSRVPEADNLAAKLTTLDSRIVALRSASPEATAAYEAAVSDAIEAAGSLSKHLNTDLDTVGNDGKTAMTFAMVIMAMLGLYALWNARAALHHCRRSVIAPMEGMTAAMLKLADGDNAIEVPWVARKDELGDMARSLEVFRRGYLKLDRMRAEAAEAAEAERQRLLQEEEEREAMRLGRIELFENLAAKFEKTVGEVVSGVAAASTQLQVTATSMAATAEQSAMQTSDVSSALSEASSGVTAAAAASDEFAMSIGEISRQAATSAELARVASASAANADSTISALNDSAAQVGQIVELISSIAQRTNLLALNASIEAARGGEAGRGFAVVASEVKELAAQTSKATDAVSQQIRAIQESTSASVSALKAIGNQIEQLEATSISIAAAVDQQSIAGQDLARSIDLAARSTDDVSSNIVHVRESTLATGAAASQVLSSSNELEHQAATLKSQVSEFLSHVRAA